MSKIWLETTLNAKMSFVSWHPGPRCKSLGQVMFRWIAVAWILSSCVALALGKESKPFGKGGDLDEEERARICYNFTVGDEVKREFYSPLYNQSGTYPNNTECIKRIVAPINHVILLEFRDRFHMEESPTCEFDYLEIHNGPHAYSPREAKVCGRDFPKPIMSMGRELFLKFVSDASIEYVGFKAVYQFMEVKGSELPPPQECKFNMGGSDGKFNFSGIPRVILDHAKNHSQPLDCTWRIKVKEGWKIYLTFLEYRLGAPNNCDLNFVDIIADGGTRQNRINHFCGTIAEPTATPTNEVEVRYFAQHSVLSNVKFIVLYTAFREVQDPKGCDPSTEFSCDDGWCIDASLKCNKDFNCKYRYDEDASKCHIASSVAGVLTKDHMIIILVVFTALVMGMCASITITCYNKIQERREREREYKMRRSKEVSMEMGLGPPAAPSSELEAALAAEIRLRKQHQSQACLDDDDNARYLPEVDLQAFRKHANGVLIMTGSGPVCGPNDAERQSLGDRQSVKSVPLCPQHGIYRDNGVNRDSLTPPIPPPPPPPLQAYYRMREPPSGDMNGRWSPLEDSTHASSPQGVSAQSGETGRPDLVAHR